MKIVLSLYKVLLGISWNALEFDHRPELDWGLVTSWGTMSRVNGYSKLRRFFS